MRQGVTLEALAVVLELSTWLAEEAVQAARPLAWGWLLADVASTALRVWAILLLTSPDPRATWQEGYLSLRTALRAGVIAVFGFFVAAGVAVALNAPLACALVLEVAGLVGVAQWWAQFVYLRRLAERIGDARLAGATTRVMKGMVASYAILWVAATLILTEMLSPTAQGKAVLENATSFTAAGHLGVLIFSLWYMAVLVGYRRALAAAAEARRPAADQ